jgi:hypothetical protein
MKRTLLIAAIIGLFMVTTLDLQAHHRRNGLPRLVSGGIVTVRIGQIPLFNHHSRYAQYNHHQGRHIAKEIRSNEKRIRKLEKRIARLDRHRGNYGEIRELEQEINRLERRNDYLRNQLY